MLGAPGEVGASANRVVESPDTKKAALSVRGFFSFGETPVLGADDLLGRRQQAFALHPLAGQLARAAHSFGLLTGALFRRLLVMHVTRHLPEGAFALHLLLQRFQRLVDIVVANENLNDDQSSSARRRSFLQSAIEIRLREWLPQM